MFSWFSKRSRTAQTATTVEAPANELTAPVMREIPAAPSPPPPAPARPQVPPGSAPPTRDVLVAQLRNVDPDVRLPAARELGRGGDVAAVPALVAALRDAHSAVRVAAAHALGKLRDERAVEALAGAMSSDGDGNVQSAARGALEAIGTAAADAVIAEHDARRAQAARHAAARANPTLDRSRGIDGFIEALRGDDERLHGQAADALAESGPAAVEPLAALLREESVWVRKRAAELLGRIGAARAAEPLQAALGAVSPDDRSYETYQFRDAVRRALAWVIAPPPPAEPPLAASRANGISATDDPAPARPQVEESALSDATLAQLTDEQLGQRLTEIARAALGGGRPPLDSYDARRAAARAIGEELHRRGGIDAMRAALDAYVGTLFGRHPIEQAWDGVGEWMG